MPCLPEPSVAERADLWRTAPALLQQVRRCHLEARGGRRARRALFGQADREETRRFVKEELAAIRAADQQKYNFDFSTMRPLAGPYEWQAVTAGEVSAAYQLGRLQSGLSQHRSARRLDFDAPRPTTPPEASRCGAASSTEASRAETSPAGPIRADSSPADAAVSQAEPMAAAEQRRTESDPESASVSSTSTTSTSPLTEALARRASSQPARPASTASRQASITGGYRETDESPSATPAPPVSARPTNVQPFEPARPTGRSPRQPPSPSLSCLPSVAGRFQI